MPATVTLSLLARKFDLFIVVSEKAKLVGPLFDTQVFPSAVTACAWLTGTVRREKESAKTNKRII
jgi:hypothetical protein